MEAIRSRSESPFSKSKTKTHLSDAPENGSTVTEQVKSKKKRNKCKSQVNGKENENGTLHGNDYSEEEKPTANETDNNLDSNNIEYENGINNGDSTENGNGILNVNDVKENDAFEEKIIETNSNNNESEGIEKCKNTESAAIEIEEDSTEQYCNVTETESCAKSDSSTPDDSQPESEAICENTESYSNEGPNEVSNCEANSSNQEQEIPAECSEISGSSPNIVNGSEVSSEVSSQHEDSSAVEDKIQVSPDTATKDDNSISNKITNFLGKWTCQQEQKQDTEVSSSKKIEGAAVNHPYLSKVSGRRGIKDRLNSSATVFSSKEMEATTPENSGISLDDSFRVRTNPPRLSSSELNENPTLRKFKGKRCLNVGDEPGDEDEAYENTMKRRKLNEKAETGLLGSILWTPFKKKSYDNGDELKLRTTESKLSRLLSPFWFWKKTAESQNRE